MNPKLHTLLRVSFPGLTHVLCRAQIQLAEARTDNEKTRKCVRAAVARAAEYKALAETYFAVAHQQATESAAIWALSMGACAGMPSFTVVRTPAVRGLVNPKPLHPKPHQVHTPASSKPAQAARAHPVLCSSTAALTWWCAPDIPCSTSGAQKVR